jgi:hypothetical protein
MSAKLTRKNSAELTQRQIDWTEFDALTDEQIAAAVREDPDAAPIVDRSWFESARSAPPKRKAEKTTLNPQLVGAFGEKAVEAELLRQGWRTANFNTSIKNSADHDLIAVKFGRVVHLRIKTCGPKLNAFQFTSRVGHEMKTDVSDADYTILVRMGADRSHDHFYVIPTRTLHEQINAWRRAALSQRKPQRDGGHWTLRLAEVKGDDERPNYGFERKWQSYRGKWELLDG